MSDGTTNVLLSVQIDDGAFDSSLTVDGIPKVNNHSIVTQAVVANGDSLLLGGYQYERNQTSTSQVPVLGNLPYVGALFRDKQTQVERQERLILITPRIKTVATLPVQTGTVSATSPSSSNPPALVHRGNDPTPRNIAGRRAADISAWSNAVPPLPPGLPDGTLATKGQNR